MPVGDYCSATDIFSVFINGRYEWPFTFDCRSSNVSDRASSANKCPFSAFYGAYSVNLE